MLHSLKRRFYPSPSICIYPSQHQAASQRKLTMCAIQTKLDEGHVSLIIVVIVSVDLVRDMLKLWKWYQNCLAVHPVKTQVISSGLIWGVGDIAAQAVTHSIPNTNSQIQDGNKEFKINWKRVAATSLFGVGFVGPVGHYWYEGLDRYIRLKLLLKPNSFRFVASKVAIDGFLFAPFDLLVFFTYMGFSTGKSIPQIKEDVKRDFLPAFVLEGGIWPIAQVANFRFIPVRYQLLYVNLFCLLDSCFLSWVEQQQDAQWKERVKSFLPLE